MPRQPIGEKPLTNAERQARYRAAHVAGLPATRTRLPGDNYPERSASIILSGWRAGGGRA